jgi:hypothetical protein
MDPLVRASLALQRSGERYGVFGLALVGSLVFLGSRSLETPPSALGLPLAGGLFVLSFLLALARRLGFRRDPAPGSWGSLLPGTLGLSAILALTVAGTDARRSSHPSDNLKSEPWRSSLLFYRRSLSNLCRT